MGQMVSRRLTGAQKSALGASITLEELFNLSLDLLSPFVKWDYFLISAQASLWCCCGSPMRSCSFPRGVGECGPRTPAQRHWPNSHQAPGTEEPDGTQSTGPDTAVLPG